MTDELPPPVDLEQLLAEDEKWEQETELTGWEKVQAFIARVLGEEDEDN